MIHVSRFSTWIHHTELTGYVIYLSTVKVFETSTHSYVLDSKGSIMCCLSAHSAQQYQKEETATIDVRIGTTGERGVTNFVN